MAKGSFAKANLANKLRELYGNNFITEENNKIYIWEDDNGTMVQLAISSTCPKTQVDAISPGKAFPDPVEKKKEPIAEITQEERDNVNKLLESLNF